MNIGNNLKYFTSQHKKKKNQIIFQQEKCKNNKIILNLINKILVKKNSFIFESVERRTIRGRYTIIGSDPDKIWELNNDKIYIVENNKKKLYLENLMFF